MSIYRIFISYSHEDQEVAGKLVKILEENGLIPMWDRDFITGDGFPEQIKNFIAHAHVFVPLITEASSKRGWVHQEIGYAMALNVPILPVTLDKVPGEMLQLKLAISWTDDAESMKKSLSLEKFAHLVASAQGKSPALFECAELHEHRTQMMNEYANRVLEIGFYGHVRQQGALSSFHLPDKPVSDPIWKERYGSFEASEFRCQLLLEERLVLEKHARDSGCSLIINPYLKFEKYGKQARMSRLKTLLNFLTSMPDDKVRVAITKKIPRDLSLTIVGDWFIAESVSASPGKGYRQTIFTRHAPTVHRKIELFDREFDNIQQAQPHQTVSSRESAINEIKKLLNEIGKQQR